MPVRYFVIQSSSSDPGINDGFNLKINGEETIDTQTESQRFEIELLQEDSNADQTEAATISFPSGNFDDSNVTPAEVTSQRLDVWLSGTSADTPNGVTNPANANGQNDANTCDLQSVALGSNMPQITSNINDNVPIGANPTAVLFRGWFRARTTVATSSCSIIAHADDASFADIILYTFSEVAGDDNRLSGSFTFDLFAAGINTNLKLRHLQIRFRTSDAVAGVTAAIMNVDAARCEISMSLF